MDRITKGLLTSFVSENGLESLEEDMAFEHFAGYVTASAHYNESFSSEDISVGGGNDLGIDCIAIIVNGTLVTEPEEVDDLAKINSYLDVVFLFIQAERSDSFSTQKLGQFVHGVLEFFAEDTDAVLNEKITLKLRIAKEIFDRSRLLKSNPQCHIYYATTGNWQGDANVVARMSSERKRLEALNLFRHVGIECVGAAQLHSLYRQTQSSVNREIIFGDRIVVPEIPGVEQAFVGHVDAQEFLKLIENERGEIIASVFYDNVRHWQEWNAVNTEMKATLGAPETALHFPILNNGITIVTNRVAITGNKVLLEDYQIVNGCQTSFVLHQCRENLSNKIVVPVRVVSTKDDAIKSAIIKATNRQTEVSEEQLFSSSEFSKKLEAFFETYEGKKALYYERRSRYYHASPGVEKTRIITTTVLVRAFAAVFLDLPHRTTRNYSALWKSVGAEIFGTDHRLEPYYVAAFSHYRLDYLFRNQLLPSELKPARYHLLMAYRMLLLGDKRPAFNAHKMKPYCDKYLESLWDEEESLRMFEEAAVRVREVAEGNLDRDHIRTEPFTSDLIRRLRPPRSK